MHLLQTTKHATMHILLTSHISMSVLHNEPCTHILHYASKLEVILSDLAAWRLSHSKVTRKPPLLDELISFGQWESAPAILGLY